MATTSRRMLKEIDFDRRISMTKKEDEWMQSVRFSVESSDPRKMINVCIDDYFAEYSEKLKNKSSSTIEPPLSSSMRSRRSLLQPVSEDADPEATPETPKEDTTRVFSVWRPTKMDALKILMGGKGVGKGLDIKGKSAKKGKLAGYVPYVQIHNNDFHKKMIGSSSPEAKLRLFFKDESSRDQAYKDLGLILEEMTKKVDHAGICLKYSDNLQDEDRERYLQIVTTWKMYSPGLKLIDNIRDVWGVELHERLFIEAYIMRGDCTREKESELDTGRESQPDFFLMNMHSTRKSKPNKPRAVVVQINKTDPMDPMSLVMAYEEEIEGSVCVNPVVSDFDPFLVGTKGVSFDQPIEKDQIEVLSWCIDEIENILKNPESSNWVKLWLEVLKRATMEGFKPKIPEHGFGDPISVDMIKYAVDELLFMASGPVRHGPECFNYYFPQAMDNYFLVMSRDQFGTDVPYKYMTEAELRDFLLDQIKMGFTFPMNPKWILTHPGWRDVWNALSSSKHPHVQESLGIWFPGEIRERLEKLCKEYKPPPQIDGNPNTSSEESQFLQNVDLAMLELRRHIVLKRAKMKLRGVLMFMRLTSKKKKKGLIDDSDDDSVLEEINDVFVSATDSEERISIKTSFTKANNFNGLVKLIPPKHLLLGW
eukprot:CAMPEP_0178944046 /NCGR_PEP_ID=MMETSP0789-20121207/2925_1 /TAXON_ID=3005 /ORGANISM="Rhizosolenia setigera, Strain CCMP 1694" /LENGTH=649 /DNA_ID=CAMNT_0020623709 /DNA_START=36 /DNA_END=1982 /DNA_ORIENTATION=-